MKKDKFNTKLAQLAKTLSPKEYERDLVGKIYQSFNDLFGVANCIQIGSYPRFTAVTPIKDLDILYFLGDWSTTDHTPSAALQDLDSKLRNDYENPTEYEIDISLQTHSVTIAYRNNEEEMISVDIVPAYVYGKNEFSLDTYMVPEVLKEKNHKKRKDVYLKLLSEHRGMSWIKSDPRGYIKVASELDLTTGGRFRKAVKIIKTWKNNLAEKDQNLKLKSFHTEQVVTKLFQTNPDFGIIDIIFIFFLGLSEVIKNPNQIRDRANTDKFIDDYLGNFTPAQLEKFEHARDAFLKQLEETSDEDDLNDLLLPNFYKRSNASEEFLFDKGFTTFTDPAHSDFDITADITGKDGIFVRLLNKLGAIDSGRYLKFKKTKNIDGCEYRWKVKNDDASEQPRGEITIGKTKNVPEHTKFSGKHFVECYAVKDSVCIAKARQNVFLP